ncbi:MAG TPA: beta-propeller fold lactonase family protein, partial [Opitutus sp.]|nr:beta-propeller fold lactonase family protein [Opitutus sp.]
MPHHLFIGTYTNKGSKGIYSLQLDPATGALSAATLAAETASPTYIAFSPDRRRLYAVSESTGLAAAFVVSDDRTQLLPLSGTQPPAGKAPCHLMTDATGRVLVLAHYHDGLVASMPIAEDGTLGPPASVIRHQGSSVNPDRQSSPHAHSVTLSPDNRFVFACDLGTDKIYIYRIDHARATLTPHEPAFVSAPAGV